MDTMKAFVHNNKVNIAVLMFVFLAFAIHYNQPVMLYTENGGFREFGVGYLHKTVFPIWLVIIFLENILYLLF